MSDDVRHGGAASGEGEDELRGHTFDGIQEYDNRLPNWWLAILFGSIVFALAYWIWFHTIGAGDLPRESFDAEMQAAAEARLARATESGLSNQALLMMAKMDDRVAAGRQIFEQYCVVCHSENGGGLVGPNLTDDYWIHGGTPMDIHKVVTEGVTAKGMAAWGNQLGPTRVNNVVAYVLTLRGTGVPGKAPEGDYYDLAAESFTDEETENDEATETDATTGTDAGPSATGVGS